MSHHINQLEVYTDLPRWVLVFAERSLKIVAFLTRRKIDFSCAGPLVEPDVETVFEPDELEWGPGLDRGWRDEDGGVEELCL